MITEQRLYSQGRKILFLLITKIVHLIARGISNKINSAFRVGNKTLNDLANSSTREFTTNYGLDTNINESTLSLRKRENISKRINEKRSWSNEKSRDIMSTFKKRNTLISVNSEVKVIPEQTPFKINMSEVGSNKKFNRRSTLKSKKLKIPQIYLQKVFLITY